MNEHERTSLSEAEKHLRRALDPRPGQVEAVVRHALAVPDARPGRFVRHLPGRVVLAALSLAGLAGLALLLGPGADRPGSANPPLQPSYRLVNLGSVVALTTAGGQVQSIVAQGENP
jgi:hypothetical protein